MTAIAIICEWRRQHEIAHLVKKSNEIGVPIIGEVIERLAKGA